jgi:hypothetical protein
MNPILVCWHDAGRGDGFLASCDVVPDHCAARDPQFWQDRLPLGYRFEVYLHPQGQSDVEGLRNRHLVAAGRVTGATIPAAPDAHLEVLPASVTVRVDGELRRAVLVDGVFELVAVRAVA